MGFAIPAVPNDANTYAQAHTIKSSDRSMWLASKLHCFPDPRLRGAWVYTPFDSMHGVRHPLAGADPAVTGVATRHGDQWGFYIFYPDRGNVENM